MKRLSLQWRITLLTVLLIGAACVSMKLLLCASGLHYMDSIGSFIQDYGSIAVEGEPAFFDPELAGMNEDVTIVIHGAKASFVTVHGRTAAAILETARSHKCGLIALGAYGHSRIREMVLGSTTTQVVSRAHVPVLIVR